jgi:hypothetical protein
MMCLLHTLITRIIRIQDRLTFHVMCRVSELMNIHSHYCTVTNSECVILANLCQSIIL